MMVPSVKVTKGDECRRTSETSRHDTGRVHWRVAGVREKKSATGIGDEVVTQKRKKSSEHPKQDMEGSEVQKIGRP